MVKAEEIAEIALKIKAIKLRPNNPFTWASGYKMPIYNDNRLFLCDFEYREKIMQGFKEILLAENISFDIVAGTSTAGIPHATILADYFKKPLIYIRDKPKPHGMQNQIEGIDAESDLMGKEVILIEDLISTGGSSVKAVNAIRSANGICNYCFSIFDYGFEKAKEVFNGDEAYDKEGNKLKVLCNVRSLLTYDVLLNVAKKTNYINDSEFKMLESWRKNPFDWGKANGFE
jgi:orotate phosphoribosyltransferase